MHVTAVSLALLTPGEKKNNRVQICCGEKLFAFNKIVTFIRFMHITAKHTSSSTKNSRCIGMRVT